MRNSYWRSLTFGQKVAEVLGALFVFTLPIFLLFMGEAFKPEVLSWLK